MTPQLPVSVLRAGLSHLVLAGKSNLCVLMWRPFKCVSRVSISDFLGKECYILFLVQSANQPVGKNWSFSAYLTLMGGLEHDVSNLPVQYKGKESFWTRQLILLFSVHAWCCAGDLSILCLLENANNFFSLTPVNVCTNDFQVGIPCWSNHLFKAGRLHCSPCQRALMLLSISQSTSVQSVSDCGMISCIWKARLDGALSDLI